MESEGNEIVNGQLTDAQSKYLIKLLPVIKQRGFSHLRIDDIARYMDISKATFYKHFASKEQVLELVVAMICDYLNKVTTMIEDEATSYVKRFQNAFGQSLFIASYLSDTFLLDLKQMFPVFWERIKQVQQERQHRLQRFYEQGVRAEVFQPLNAVLMVLQEELVLRNIMDPVLLMEHDLTLRTALYDYYELQKYQWLVPELRKQVDDAPMKEYIDLMARKISLSIRADFVV